jgi:hypothetical protein
MLLNRAIRSIALASLCTLSMVIAHLLGGGEPTIRWCAPLVFVFSATLIFLKNPKDFSGPKLGSVLLLFQFAGHFSFGASSNGGRMSMAHFAAVVISFHLVRHFEEILSRVGIFITHNIIFEPINLPEKLVLIAAYFERIEESQRVLRHLRERAPPSIAAA